MSQNDRENRDFEGDGRSPDPGGGDGQAPRVELHLIDSEVALPQSSEKALIQALMQERATVIRETFGEDADPEAYTLTDCLKECKRRADEKTRLVRNELMRFKIAGEEWGAMKEQAQMRMREKRRFRKAVERYAEEKHGKVLFNLNYWYYKIGSFIDAALILPNAVLLLNLRVPNHDSVVDEDGNLCWLNPYSAKLEKENIRNELFKQELMVRMMLSGTNLDQWRVLTSLIVGGDEFQFVNHDEDNVTSGRLAELEKRLTLEHSDCFTEDERIIVAKTLWAEKDSSEDRCPSCHSNLLDAYRALQAKLSD